MAGMKSGWDARLHEATEVSSRLMAKNNYAMNGD
jgi:hypothetical protein